MLIVLHSKSYVSKNVNVAIQKILSKTDDLGRGKLAHNGNDFYESDLLLCKTWGAFLWTISDVTNLMMHWVKDFVMTTSLLLKSVTMGVKNGPKLCDVIYG